MFLWFIVLEMFVGKCCADYGSNLLFWAFSSCLNCLQVRGHWAGGGEVFNFYCVGMEMQQWAKRGELCSLSMFISKTDIEYWLEALVSRSTHLILQAQSIIYIYIYIYKTETFETPTIFHVSTTLKKIIIKHKTIKPKPKKKNTKKIFSKTR